jgi:hypothetical protein
VIQKELINELSRQVLSGKFAPGETIFVDTDLKGFVFSDEGFAGKGVNVEKSAKGVKEVKQEKAKAEGEEKRKKELDTLMKATKDVEDAVKNVKGSEEG